MIILKGGSKAMDIERERLWVMRIKNKDENALYEVIQSYGSWVKSIIKRKLIYLPEEQEECLNDTFLKVWEQIDKYDETKGTFKNWIGAIAVYRSIDTYRRVSASLEELPLRDDEVSKKYTPEVQLLKRELEEQLFSLIDNLNEEDKNIFIKLFFNDKSYDEVAKELGVKKDYLYNRVSRARKTLIEAKEEIL